MASQYARRWYRLHKIADRAIFRAKGCNLEEVDAAELLDFDRPVRAARNVVDRFKTGDYFVQNRRLRKYDGSDFFPVFNNVEVLIIVQESSGL